MHSHRACEFKGASRPVQSWVEEEFSTANLGDWRRVERLKQIVSDFASQPTSSIPKACGSWASTKAAYRFFQNESIGPDGILAAHFQATAQRLQEQGVVLALEDTSSLNYSTHPQSQGLGPIANNPSKTIGFFVHSTLAVNPAGRALGLVRVQRWARDAKQFKTKSKKRNRQPIEEKESYRWLQSYQAAQQLAEQHPQSLVVSVADREGDIYEVLAQALQPAKGPRAQVLIRAQHDRAVVDAKQSTLWALLGASALAGHTRVKVRGKNGMPKREAKLEIRYTPVRLKRPQGKGDQPELELWAIEAREIDTPAGVTPLCWRLLSSLPVNTLQEALERVQWYGQRWQIEVLHKVLKSGCQIELRQLETRERLERVLAVDLIVAWRILCLSKAARETPEAPAQQWLQAQECQALQAYLEHKDGLKIKRLSVRMAVRRIAQLGGFIGRNNDGEPGPITLWRGLLRLHDIAECWQLFGQPKQRAKKCG